MANKKTIKKSALAPTILIAGGAGFVGSHLAEVLLKKEARVIVLDNFSTGKEVHVNHLLNNPKFALFDVDINSGIPEEIESVDYIFHLAGLEEYLYSKEELNLDSLLTNAVGTKNLLDLAKKSDAKFLLASSTDVYEGMMSQLSLDKYFGNTLEAEKKYSLTEAKRYAEALVWEYYKKYNTDIRVVRLPEVYGPRMSLDSTGSLGTFLRNLIDGKDLTVYDEGTDKEHYLYINDAVAGMVKALLQEGTEGKIFSLIEKEPISVLEAAYLVKSLADRKLEITYKDKKSSIKTKNGVIDTYNLSIIKWSAQTSLKDGLIETLKWFNYGVNQNTFKQAKFIDKNSLDDLFVKAKEYSPAPEMTISYKQLPKIKKPRKKLNIKPINFKVPKLSAPNISYTSKLSLFLIIFFSFLFVFIINPFYKTYTSTRSALTNIEQVPDAVSMFNTQKAEELALQAKQDFQKSQKYFKTVDWLYKLGGQSAKYESTSRLLSSITYFSNVTLELSKALIPYSELWETIKPNSEKEFSIEKLDNSKLFITNAKNSLQLALADFSQVEKNNIPSVAAQEYDSFSDMINVAEQGLDMLSTFSTSLPDLIGFNEPKNYLILFQNNHELRPTGGFIGSYAILTMNNGKIDSLNIDDIYNPDGQLDVRNIKVSPPKPIADFLAEDRLYIRNANWDPDFNESSKQIMELFNRIDGIELAGVISMDLHLVKSLINVTGPIYLAAFNEEITQENLYERTQFNSSYDYTEGSQQKRQFLTVLGSKLIESLFSVENEKLSMLMSTLLEGLNERHLQISLSSSQLSVLLNQNNWDGALVTTPGDYLQVVNANLGGTKANYYVQNDMSYEVSSKTRDGLLRGKVVLEYEHTGIDEAWPGGPYTNYVRVLTQDGSKLTGASINQNESFEEDIFEDVVISKVGNYNSFETSFVLEPSSKTILTLYYDLPEYLSVTKESTDYNLVWQKQPGTNDDGFTYSFKPPFGMEFDEVSGKVSLIEGAAFSNGKLNKDFTASFSLK